MSTVSEAKRRAKRRIACACGRSHSIKNFDLIITHCYVKPDCYNEGDYWEAGEWHIIGPCGKNNRLMFNERNLEWYERGRIGVAAEPTFKHLYPVELWKSVTFEYENCPQRENNFNYYVSKNRKKFELPKSRKHA